MKCQVYSPHFIGEIENGRKTHKHVILLGSIKQPYTFVIKISLIAYWVQIKAKTNFNQFFFKNILNSHAYLHLNNQYLVYRNNKLSGFIKFLLFFLIKRLIYFLINDFGRHEYCETLPTYTSANPNEEVGVLFYYLFFLFLYMGFASIMKSA